MANIVQQKMNGRLIFYENLIKFESPISLTSGKNAPERVSSDIKGFSQKSRLRMFQLICSVNYSRYYRPMFCSLTFHNDCPDTKILLKKKLDIFLKRLKRQLPPFHFIWKLELQKRDTPHFHILFLQFHKETALPQFKFFKIIQKNWMDLKECKCKYCTAYSVNVKDVFDFKHAAIYVSKELGKINETDIETDLGRVWGYSRNIFKNHLEEIECSTNESVTLLKLLSEKFPERFANKTFLKSLLEKQTSYTLFFSSKDFLTVKSDFLNKYNLTHINDLPCRFEDKRIKLSDIRNKRLMKKSTWYERNQDETNN